LEIGKTKEAKDAYEAAIQNCNTLLETHSQGEEHNKLVAVRITARFNLAYWLETNDDVMQAIDMYKQILRDEPTYLDAYLRLAYIYFKKGNHPRAFGLLEDAKKNVITSKPTYQFCIKGKMLFDIC
jgi:tetratricopeptide (TPR) repeat protein